MKKTIKISIICLMIFASTYYAKAQETTTQVNPFKLLIGGALEFGGDEVAEVFFTNGESQTIRAGQGGAIAIGAQYQVPVLDKLLLQATLGFKYVTTEADNVHIRLTRVPLHFTANWMLTDKLRIGAGLATHQNIQLKADGVGQDLGFKGSSGPIFEIAYSGLGLRYTAMTYTDETNFTYVANSIGFIFSMAIPK